MMGKTRDITGQKFNRLTALRMAPTLSNRRRWLCLCDCGNEKEVDQGNLTNGAILSCGCARKKLATKDSHPLYSRWKGMLQRCRDANCEKYPRYGGRGIQVCDRWLDFDSFVEDMGAPPTKQHTLDRIDLNGNYCKENCQWADAETQMNNTSQNRFIEINGVVKTMSQWARVTGVSVATICNRITAGWNPVIAATAAPYSVIKRSAWL